MYVFKFKRIPKFTVNIQNVRTSNDVTIIIISSLVTGQNKRLSEAQQLHCFQIQQKEWETETFNKGNIKFFSFGWLRNLYFFTGRVIKHWTLQTRVARILRSVVAELKYSVSKSDNTKWNRGIIELEHL